MLSFCKHRPSSPQILGQLPNCLVRAVAEMAGGQWDEGMGFHPRLTFGKRGVVTTKDAGPFQVLEKLSWLKQRLWCRVACGGPRAAWGGLRLFCTVVLTTRSGDVSQLPPATDTPEVTALATRVPGLPAQALTRMLPGVYLLWGI